MDHPLPISMKAPRDRRSPTTAWGTGGVLQICVTRSCDMACFGCTQGSNLQGKKWMMSVEQFSTAVQSLKTYFGIVGVFGGNPALHPQFDQLCEVMREHIAFTQRGLWCNHPRGNGKYMRGVFNPFHSNLNVHLSRDAYDEFVRDWPECAPVLKGLDPEWPEAQVITDLQQRAFRVGDARHSPVYVAMKDVIMDEEERWRLIGNCDVNQYWSAMINVFRGELRGWFCEIAGAQAVLHQDEPNYPDLGVPINNEWWNRGMDSFDAQVRFHCENCGFPLRGYGDLAIGGKKEQVSKTHENIYKPKNKLREVELVTELYQLKPNALMRGTDYVQNGAI